MERKSVLAITDMLYNRMEKHAKVVSRSTTDGTGLLQ